MADTPKKVILEVGELRKALESSDDGEPLIFDLEENTLLGRKKTSLKCVGVGSSGGGRVTVIYLDRP